MDDVQVATALASCHNLKMLSVDLGGNACIFGRNGLDGLQALATGCPLLADIKVHVTVPGLHFLGTHFTNLKKCWVFNSRTSRERAPVAFPSEYKLLDLYPAVEWVYFDQ